MEDAVLNGLELNVFEHSHALFTVYIKLDSEDVGGVDKLADSVVCYNEVSGDEAFTVTDFNDFFTGFEGAVKGEFEYFTAVEHNGDQTFFTEGLGGFLAELSAGLS